MNDPDDDLGVFNYVYDLFDEDLENVPKASDSDLKEFSWSEV